MEGYFIDEEESKKINKTLNDLSVKIDHKIDELTKSIEKALGEKQEYGVLTGALVYKK